MEFIELFVFLVTKNPSPTKNKVQQHNIKINKIIKVKNSIYNN
jgi:hypothetical protein